MATNKCIDCGGTEFLFPLGRSSAICEMCRAKTGMTLEQMSQPKKVIAEGKNPPHEIHIVFDGPPEPESGRFIEVENEKGEGISVGRWEQRGDTWHLILTVPHVMTHIEALAEKLYVRLGTLRAPHQCLADARHFYRVYGPKGDADAE